ncbi:hypothetical protein KAR91_01440 [Candidatus Pacearchaeota archaeon]|nr:hypothetical protein [Candidatus Pacearchaeota archaeon]
MGKMSSVQKWFIIRDSLRELHERNTTKEGAKQPLKKKSVKRKRRRIK